jgi:hypothetical protein
MPTWLPPYNPSDRWARRAASWAASLLPLEITRAVPELSTRPRAAGRVAWYWATATLAARGRDQETLSMSAVIPCGALDGLLGEDDIAMLRALEVPLDRDTPPSELEQRLEDLRRIGHRLPVKFPQ